MNNDLVLVEQSLAEFDAVEAGLQALEASYKGVVYDVVTTKGMAEAKEARAAIRDPRIKVEKVRKEGKAPVLALGKLIDEKAKQITARLEALEDPIDAQIKTEEARKEAERAEKARIEAERVAKHQAFIDSIKGIPLVMVGKSASGIDTAIKLLAAKDCSGCEEFTVFAERAKEAALLILDGMLVDAKEQEAKQAAEAEAKKAEEERLAAERKALAEAQAALKKQQEEQAAIEAAARKERESKEAELRKVQEAAQAAIRKQQEEQEAKDAELRKAQEAAQAEIDAQKEALRKEREAIEASKAATLIQDMPAITHDADSSKALPPFILVDSLSPVDITECFSVNEQTPLALMVIVAKKLITDTNLWFALESNELLSGAHDNLSDLKNLIAEYEASHE
jgi:chemotaxis protein histidine kinase CheA